MGLPLHLRDVPGAELRLARAAPAGGLRTGSTEPQDPRSLGSIQSRGVRRVLLVTLGLNVAVAAGKVIVGQLSGSLAMVADGYHSLVDGANNVIGLVVAAFAFRPPDQGHPYGHRKFETAATAINAVYVDLTLHVDGGASLREAHDVADRIEAALVQAHPGIVDVVVHLEPEGHTAPRQD